MKIAKRFYQTTVKAMDELGRLPFWSVRIVDR
jgi:hypothetical protein